MTEIGEEYEIDESLSSLDMLGQLTRALRTLNILGQLAKKYWGELIGKDKFSLAEETFLLGLRTLKFHFSLIEGGKDALSEHIIKIIRKRFIKHELSKTEIENISANFIFTLASSSVFGIFKRIINAIGTEKLGNTFEDILSEFQFNSVRLIDAGIKLDHYDKFPSNEVDTLKKNNEKNPLGFSTLQNLVIDYLYMYPTTIERKQQICAALNIKMQEQRLIAETSQIKKA